MTGFKRNTTNLKKLQPEHVSAEPGSDLDGPWEPTHAPPRRAGQRGDRRATAGRAGRRGLGAGAALSADGGGCVCGVRPGLARE